MLLGVFVDVDMLASWSSVLLVALVRRILFDVALLALLFGVLDPLLAVRCLVQRYRLGIAGALVALVLRWDGWSLARHGSPPLLM